VQRFPGVGAAVAVMSYPTAVHARAVAHDAL
jgi:hypothetical protein